MHMAGWPRRSHYALGIELDLRGALLRCVAVLTSHSSPGTNGTDHSDHHALAHGPSVAGTQASLFRSGCIAGKV